MKKIILSIILLAGFFTAFAQQTVNVSGTFTNKGTPLVNEQIVVAYSSLDSSIAIFGYDTAYTDSNGFYSSTFLVPGQGPQGFAIVKSTDCFGGFQENYIPYFPGFYSMTLNLECVNLCQNSYRYTVDSIPGMGLMANFFLAYASPTASYNWTFGDGTSAIGPNPSHIYNGTGTYTVCVTVIDSIKACTFTYCDSVSVRTYSNACFASFSYFQDSTNANLIYFSGQAGAAPGSILTWDFGDGNISTGSASVNHVYATPGTYNVCFGYFDILQNCFTTFCDVVFVGPGLTPNCSAEFKMFMIPDSVTQGVNIIYFANTYQSPTSTYAWDFGDGTFGSGPYATHVFNGVGIYDVCSYIFDPTAGCTDTVCKRVEFVTGGMRILGVEDQKIITINALYPNPAENVSNLNLSSVLPGVANIRVMALDGRVVAQFNSELQQGTNTIELNFEGLNPGMYFVDISSNNDRATSKLIIK